LGDTMSFGVSGLFIAMLPLHERKCRRDGDE